MKEIRTIKMVEVTDVKFVADDGTEFVGEGAEKDCRDYERTCDKKKVEAAYKRLDAVNVKMPFIEPFWSGCSFYKIILNSKNDFIAMMDYFDVVCYVCDNYIDEPSGYPYTMCIASTDDWVEEYKGDLKADLQKALEQWS